MEGDVDPDLSRLERGSPEFCAMEEGFLLKTLREDLPLNSGTFCFGVVVVAVLPKPKRDPDVLGFVSGIDLVFGDGERMLGLGNPVCCVLPTGVGPLLGSVCPDICAMSASLRSTLAGPGCIYVTSLLLLGASPGRVGGSNPDLYDAIMFPLSPHHFLGDRVLLTKCYDVQSRSVLDIP